MLTWQRLTVVIGVSWSENPVRSRSGRPSSSHLFQHPSWYGGGGGGVDSDDVFCLREVHLRPKHRKKLAARLHFDDFVLDGDLLHPLPFSSVPWAVKHSGQWQYGHQYHPLVRQGQSRRCFKHDARSLNDKRHQSNGQRRCSFSSIFGDAFLSKATQFWKASWHSSGERESTAQRRPSLKRWLWSLWLICENA